MAAALVCNGYAVLAEVDIVKLILGFFELQYLCFSRRSAPKIDLGD